MRLGPQKPAEAGLEVVGFGEEVAGLRIGSALRC